MTSIKYNGTVKKGCSSCGSKQSMVTKYPKREFRVPTEDDPKKQTTVTVRHGQVVTLPNKQAKVLLSIVENNKSIFRLL